jgi:hypothetical protein
MGPVALASDDLDAVIHNFVGRRQAQSRHRRTRWTLGRSLSHLAARANGVRVPLILEGDYLMEAHSSADTRQHQGSLRRTGSSTRRGAVRRPCRTLL